MKHQILIASYHKDFQWLEPNLVSLKKFLPKSFLPPVISVSSEDAAEARSICNRVYPEAEVWTKDGPPGKGNLRAQISMMCGDLFCHRADYIWLVGSDCLLSRPLDPDFFFKDGLPIMQINSYDYLVKYVPGVLPWRDGVTNALGFCPVYEFMRRLPLIYPHWLFRAVREHIETFHSTTFENYVYGVENDKREYRSDSANFSESNVLGAYAFRFHPDAYAWNNRDNLAHSTVNPLIQFWSHGGFDFVNDVSFDFGDGKNTFGLTPRQVITEILGADAIPKV